MAKAPVKKNNSSLKRAKQSATRHARNTSVLSMLKTQEKKVLKALEAESAELKELFKKFISMLDKAVKTNVLTKNKASRKKSVFNKRVVTGKGAAKPAVKKPKPQVKATKKTKAAKK